MLAALAGRCRQLRRRGSVLQLLVHGGTAACGPRKQQHTRYRQRLLVLLRRCLAGQHGQQQQPQQQHMGQPTCMAAVPRPGASLVGKRLHGPWCPPCLLCTEHSGLVPDLLQRGTLEREWGPEGRGMERLAAGKGSVG